MTRASTNFNPLLKVGAGKGTASINIVKTAAINDICVPFICENAIESAVPKARRRIRRLAISGTIVANWAVDATDVSRRKSKSC